MRYLGKYIPTNQETKKDIPSAPQITEITIGLDELDEELIQKTYKKIGENVKKIRQEKNFSQLALAQAIGHKSVSVVSCAEICHKNYHFNIEHLVKISGVLEVNICDFFEGVDKMIGAVRDYKKMYE